VSWSWVSQTYYTVRIQWIHHRTSSSPEGGITGFSTAIHLRLLGVRILEGCEVGDLQRSGDRISGVITSTGHFSTRTVLLGTSVWGAAQLARVGIEVPVDPHRAEMAFFHVPPAESHRIVRILSDTRATLYLRPEGSDQAFVGSRESDRKDVNDMVPEDPDHYKQTTHFHTLRDMQQRLAMTLRFMAKGFVHHTYACVYDYTLDAMPILD